MGLLGSIFKAVPVVGDVLSANASKKATKKATAAQIEAINKAIGGLNTQFQQTSDNLNPTIIAGNDALSSMRGLIGLNGAGEQQGAIDALRASPLFQSLFDTGRDTILGSASATGGLRGGNVNAALSDFGRNTLAQVLQQQLSNLGGLQGQGLRAALGLGEFGQKNATTIADLTTGIGKAQAGSILNRQAIDNNLYAGLRQKVESAIGGLGGLGGIASSLGSLFGGAGGGLGGGGGGTLSGAFPSIIGASNNPINLGTIDTTPLIQRIGF